MNDAQMQAVIQGAVRHVAKKLAPVLDRITQLEERCEALESGQILRLLQEKDRRIAELEAKL